MFVSLARCDIDELFIECVCNDFMCAVMSVVELDSSVVMYVGFFVRESSNGFPEEMCVGFVVKGLVEVLFPYVCFVVVDGCVDVFVEMIDGRVLRIVLAFVVSLLNELSDVLREDAVFLWLLSAFGYVFVVCLEDDFGDVVICVVDVCEGVCADVLLDLVGECLPVCLFEVGECSGNLFCAEVGLGVNGDEDG